MKYILAFIFSVLFSLPASANMMLIPMEEDQTNHLKAYGVAYHVIEAGEEVEWLLNYRGGSFVFPYDEDFEREAIVREVSFEMISNAHYQQILRDIEKPEVNQNAIELEKAPEIAVYAPDNHQPWDDAVTLALDYAEIPYELIYDDEVLRDELPQYDWLHLHHEDFTGQFGKFWANYRNQPWYQEEERYLNEIADRWGYPSVAELKLDVSEKIRDYVIGGGYLFTMCSAPETIDIALAAHETDIVGPMFNDSPMDQDANENLDYSRTFAFEDFTVSENPYEYSYSDIDNDPRSRNISPEDDFFTLREFSAKWDKIPTMLNQNHTRVVPGFLGQTTAFREQFVKSDVTILGEFERMNEVRYIHGTEGDGMWTFYSGHDPEDYRHLIGDPPTDLDLYPNSPGYRLILNNVLFPAASPEERKTDIQDIKEEPALGQIFQTKQCSH